VRALCYNERMKFDFFDKIPNHVDYGSSTLEERAMVRNALLLDPENKKLSSEDLEKLVAEEVNLKD